MTPADGAPAGEEATDERLVDQRHVRGTGACRGRRCRAPAGCACRRSRTSRASPCSSARCDRAPTFPARQARRPLKPHVLPLTGVTTDPAAERTPGSRPRRPSAAGRAACVRRFDLATQRVDVDDEDRIAIEPQPHVREPREASDEKTRGDDQHERERDLRDDQPARKADATAAAGAAAVLLERVDRETRAARNAGAVPKSSAVATSRRP